MKRIKILLGIVFTAFLFSIILLQVIGKKVNPIVLKYSTIEAERFGTYVINFSLDQEFINNLDEDVFKMTKNSKGEIQMVEFKTKKVNELLEEVAEKVQNNLIKLENGNIEGMNIADTFKGLRYKKIKHGVVCELPTGILYSNALFANNGPNVPVKLNFIGKVLTNINTKVASYGINSVYLEVFIHIEVEERITMPMQTKSIKVETDIPLTINVIQGTIPNYYQSLLQRDSSVFTLPIE